MPASEFIRKVVTDGREWAGEVRLFCPRCDTNLSPAPKPAWSQNCLICGLMITRVDSETLTCSWDEAFNPSSFRTLKEEIDGISEKDILDVPY